MSAAKQPSERRGLSLLTLAQSVYLTVAFYTDNDLISFASACAFGFLFSFVPVVMLILIVLIRILHASPETLATLFGNNAEITQFLNLEAVAHTVQQINAFTNFEVILFIFIIWMARRFFFSLVSGINQIFRQGSLIRPIVRQLVSLAVEAVLVILISAVVFVIILFKAAFKLSILRELVIRYPRLLGSFSALLVNTLPFLIIFIIAAACYREVSRAKPPLALCAASSALFTIAFMVFQRMLGIFLNVNNYNIVYGVLSNTIVLLVEVFSFFILFLFFGQFLFVRSYFDALLLSELYLLPRYGDTSPAAAIRRLLFIRPDALLRQDANVINRAKGEHIYRRGEGGDCAYYLAQGTVRLQRLNNLAFIERGDFFGEEACMLNEIRSEDAVADTAVQLVRIPEDLFFSVLEKNPKVSMKVLSRISRYFAKFYGRTGNYPL